MPKYETQLIIFRVNENYERHAQNFNYHPQGKIIAEFLRDSVTEDRGRKQRVEEPIRTLLITMREQNISSYRGVAKGVLATDNLHNQSAALPLLRPVKLISNVIALTSRIHLFCFTSSSSSASSKTGIKAHQQKQMINCTTFRSLDPQTANNLPSSINNRRKKFLICP